MFKHCCIVWFWVYHNIISKRATDVGRVIIIEHCFLWFWSSSIKDAKKGTFVRCIYWKDNLMRVPYTFFDNRFFCEGHLILTVMCDLLPFKSIFRKEVWHKHRYHNSLFDFCFLFRFRRRHCNKGSQKISCLTIVPPLTFETFLILAHPFSKALVIYRNQLKSEKMQNSSRKLFGIFMPKCMGNLHIWGEERREVN